MKNEVLTTDRTLWSVLTPDRRKAIYGIAAAIGALIVAFGGATPEYVQGWLDVIDKLLVVIIPLMGFFHTGGTYTAPTFGAPEGDDN